MSVGNSISSSSSSSSGPNSNSASPSACDPQTRRQKRKIGRRVIVGIIIFIFVGSIVFNICQSCKIRSMRRRIGDLENRVYGIQGQNWNVRKGQEVRMQQFQRQFRETIADMRHSDQLSSKYVSQDIYSLQNQIQIIKKKLKQIQSQAGPQPQAQPSSKPARGEPQAQKAQKQKNSNNVMDQFMQQFNKIFGQKTVTNTKDRINQMKQLFHNIFQL